MNSSCNTMSFTTNIFNKSYFSFADGTKVSSKELKVTFKKIYLHVIGKKNDHLSIYSSQDFTTSVFVLWLTIFPSIKWQ